MDNISVRAKHLDFIIIDLFSILASLISAYLFHIDRVDDHLYFSY